MKIGEASNDTRASCTIGDGAGDRGCRPVRRGIWKRRPRFAEIFGTWGGRIGAIAAKVEGSRRATQWRQVRRHAPARLCEGLTEDGCRLRWQEVPTIEGPAEYQCVAYCPWQ
ncbi:hypothetical protein BLTE_07240 [Blastochloris tepida]|uniref:Uncharacterized protein n=1 Tax=Blastochloris tepida TaxID=2233851 RepID=A0A348FXK6_9HYPH|nr:hypothetical protein BLTE_07240 [Blastochloris tepida]